MGNNDKQLRVIVFCDQYENTLREAPTLLVTNQIVGVWVEGGPDGGGEVLDISWGREVRPGPSYPDLV